MASAFSVATGKSATPIIVDVSVSITAEAPPLIGSVGPISTSNSRGRYLNVLVGVLYVFKRMELTASDPQS